LSEKPNDADSIEAVEGLNVTMTVQLPPATTGVATEQVVAVMAKSAAFVPDTDGAAVKFRGAVPVFISVTVIAALVTPCDCVPNGKLAGRVTAGAVPVPVSETVWGLGTALSAKLRDAFSAALVEGLNVRVTVQLEPAATGEAVEQVAAVIAKSAAFVPVTLGLLVNVSDALPVFISVTVIVGLVVPLGTEPNGSLAGRLTTGAGAPVPVPVSGTL